MAGRQTWRARRTRSPCAKPDLHPFLGTSHSPLWLVHRRVHQHQPNRAFTVDQSPGEQRSPDQFGCCRNHGQHTRSDERFHHNDHQRDLGFRQIVRPGDAFEWFNRPQNGPVESDFRERRIKNNRLRRDFAQWNQWRRLFSDQNQRRSGHFGALNHFQFAIALCRSYGALDYSGALLQI